VTADLLPTAAGLVAVVNPLGAIPSFLAMTERLPSDARRSAARRAAIAAGLALLVASLAGGPLLHALGVGIPAFRVAGGILLLLIAVSRLDTPHAVARTPSDDDDAAIVPLGIPTLAGPGAISAVVLHAQKASGAAQMASLATAVAASALASWAALRLASPIGRAMGPTGMKVASRLTSLLLAAVAVGFIADGATALFPALR
jgi:multiple antibiotic resistance protein